VGDGRVVGLLLLRPVDLRRARRVTIGAQPPLSAGSARQRIVEARVLTRVIDTGGVVKRRVYFLVAVGALAVAATASTGGAGATATPFRLVSR